MPRALFAVGASGTRLARRSMIGPSSPRALPAGVLPAKPLRGASGFAPGFASDVLAAEADAAPDLVGPIPSFSEGEAPGGMPRPVAPG